MCARPKQAKRNCWRGWRRRRRRRASTPRQNGEAGNPGFQIGVGFASRPSREDVWVVPLRGLAGKPGGPKRQKLGIHLTHVVPTISIIRHCGRKLMKATIVSVLTVALLLWFSVPLAAQYTSTCLLYTSPSPR